MKNRNFTWFLSLIALAIVGAETKAEPIVPEYGLLLTRTGQSADRSSRRFSYFQFDDPVHSKLVDGTLSKFSPGEDETVGDDNRLKWKRVEFNDSGAIEERGLYLYAPVECAPGGKHLQPQLLSCSGAPEQGNKSSAASQWTRLVQGPVLRPAGSGVA
jgi:hypothetical protein